MQLDNNDSNLEKSLMEQASNKGIPINGSIELLPLCNMNCHMCYVRLDKKEMEQKGRLRTLEEWIQMGKEMQKAGVLFLLMTGGEPLLYPHFKELYLELKKLGMIITINTNGTLIDEEWADFFSKNKPRRINITLYGASNHTYEELCQYPNGYDRVINGIKLLKDRNIDVKIAGSITKSNKHEIRDLIEIGDTLKSPVRCDTYMMPATRERDKKYDLSVRLNPIEAARARVLALKLEMGKELFKEYVEKSIFEVENILPTDEEKHMNCYAGKCSFSINWQGELHPCVIMTYPSINVFNEGFQKSWEYIQEETYKILLNRECNNCNKRTLCRTCGACALLESGRYDGIPQYMCDYTNETYRLLRLEYQNLTKKEEKVAIEV